MLGCCSMGTLWARTSTFDSVQVGDNMPILIKDLFAEAIEPGSPAFMGFARELLVKGLPPERVHAEGSSVELVSSALVEKSDTLTFLGRVSDKRSEAGVGFIDCEVQGVNQADETVAHLKATVRFDPPSS